MNKIKEILKHNIFLTAAVCVVILLGTMFIGCQPTAKSPLNPDIKMTRTELDAEKELVLAKFKAAYSDIAQQELLRQKIFEIGLVAAEGGTVNPIGAAVTLLGVLGIGAVADNRRKDTVIKTLQNKDPEAQ